MDLVNSGIYSKLLDVYVNWDEPVPLLEWEGPFPLLSYNSMEIAFVSPLLINAYDNLQRKPKIFFSDLITYNKFYYFFPFLEWVYSMYVERKLESEDIRRIFGSNIGEKIVFALEDFDEIKEIPDITPEFFQKVGRINWKDKKVKKLYSKLEKALCFLVFKSYGFKEAGFNVRQIDIVLFLAGCSAVSEGKEKIDENNVFIAYKTLFKIIRTDISKFIE